MDRKAEILEAADKLAEALKNSPEWLRWEEASSTMEKDIDINKNMDEYRQLSSKWQAARYRGQQLSGPEALKMGELKQEILSNPVYAEQERASNALTELIKETNASLTKQLGIDFASTALPGQSGCCG